MAPSNWDTDDGAGGDGNNSEIYLLGNPDNRAVITGGSDGHASASGEGGNGGHGNNDRLVVTGPALPAGTVQGGNGSPGRPGDVAGLGNNGTITGDITALNGTAGPTLPCPGHTPPVAAGLRGP